MRAFVLVTALFSAAGFAHAQTASPGRRVSRDRYVGIVASQTTTPEALAQAVAGLQWNVSNAAGCSVRASLESIVLPEGSIARFAQPVRLVATVKVEATGTSFSPGCNPDVEDCSRPRPPERYCHSQTEQDAAREDAIRAQYRQHAEFEYVEHEWTPEPGFRVGG